MASTKNPFRKFLIILALFLFPLCSEAASLLPAVTEAPTCPTSPPSSESWTGSYDAGESTGKGELPFMFMNYNVLLFRESQGILRAFITIDGQTTMKRIVACGELKGHRLILRFARDRWDAESRRPGELNKPVLFLERQGPRGWVMRFPEGSYLQDKPVLKAERHPIPPWTGHYSFSTCPEGQGKPDCWNYEIDIALNEEGWQAKTSVKGPNIEQQLLAVGEREGFDSKVEKSFVLVFWKSAGSASNQVPYQQGESLGTLLRGQNRGFVLKFYKLIAPPGLPQAPLKKSDKAPARNI
jgi:hypothetical protein